MATHQNVMFTHIWGDTADARRAFPKDKAVETVTGYATAARYEATTRDGMPATRVFGTVIHEDDTRCHLCAARR